MATAPQTLLTLEEFDARYGSEPGWEYWFGEAVRKPVPTWYHGVLQVVLANLLLEAGYFSGSEIDLKVDPRWQPRPDVLKCRLYQRIGIPAIYVADPESESHRGVQIDTSPRALLAGRVLLGFSKMSG